MKEISIILGLIFFLSGCTKTDYDYKLENSLLDCFYEYHKANNIDIKSTIDKIENVLVKHKILLDKTGESYIKAIRQIKDNYNLEIDNPELLADINSIGYIPSGIFCNDSSYVSRIDSIDLANSKLKYIISIFDSIQVKGDISPTLIAEEILEVFNAKDFKNEYYKTMGLVMFSNMIKMNDFGNGLVRKLPPALKEETNKIEKQNILAITVNKENRILVNDKLVEISDLKEMVKKFLLEKSDKKEIDLPLIGKQETSLGVISLQNDIGTSYKVYIAVQDEVTEAYTDIRNSYSMEFFNSTFENLNEEKQEVIKDLVPLSISEAEPKMN